MRALSPNITSLGALVHPHIRIACSHRNDMSSFSEKLVDFDIMVETEPRNVAPAKPTSLVEQTSSLEESIYKLSGSLSSIQRTQKCRFRLCPTSLGDAVRAHADTRPVGDLSQTSALETTATNRQSRPRSGASPSSASAKQHSWSQCPRSKSLSSGISSRHRANAAWCRCDQCWLKLGECVGSGDGPACYAREVTIGAMRQQQYTIHHEKGAML